MSKFVKNTLKLAGSTTVAQVVSVLLAPIQTRIFSPEFYGIYGFFFSIASTLTILSTVRFEFAILTVEEKRSANNLFAIVFAIPFIFAIIIWLTLLLFGEKLFNFFGGVNLSPYSGLLAITIFISGTITLFKYYNLRNENFNIVAISNMINSSFSSILMVVLGVLGLNNSYGLIYGNLLGTLLAWLTHVFFFIKNEVKAIIGELNFSDMFTQLRVNSKPSLINTISAFFGFFSMQVPSILLTSLFGPEINGYYVLGYKVLKMPSILIGQALSSVFFQSATEARKEGKLGFLVEQSMSKLINIGLFPILLLTVAGRDLVMIIFGPGWSEAGVFIQILGLWIFASFISTPISTALIVIGKNKFFLKFNIFLLISRVISLYAGYLLDNSRFALFFMSISGVLIYGWMGWSVLRITGSNLKRLSASILSINRIAILLLLEVILVQAFFSGNSLLIAINALLLGSTFMLLLIWKDPEINGIIRNLVKNLMHK